MNSLVSDLQYFPPSIYYLRLNDFKHCVLEQYDHFQKMTYRNRCIVEGSNGPVILSVPLHGGRNQKTLMKDVRILNTERWQDHHWKTLTSVYNKSPWFDYYRHELEALYSTKFELLKDWNLACMKWICDKLSIRTTLTLSSTYEKGYPENEYEDWRNLLKPSTINKVFSDPPRYPQVFEDRTGFLSNLSILDYLFCAGNRLTN